MPWSKEDVDEHKKGLSDKQKEQWVAIANEVREECLENGGSEEECDVKAIKQANGIVNNMAKQNQIRICTKTDKNVHREERLGRNYLVAPVVAVTEGVLKGEFLPGEEIQSAAPIFNDKPLPVGHPKSEDGEPLSAQNREIIENQSVGRFWDVTYEDNKLKGNLWVDIQKAKELGGQAEEVLNKLENNEQVDVSTAYWPDVESETGIYNGEKYDGVQRNLTPDHLALLPDTKGECSWEDGCGAPRINSEGDYMTEKGTEPETNEDEQAQNIAKKVWSNLKHFIGDREMSETVEVLTENTNFDAEALEDMDEEKLEAWADAYTANESDDESGEEPEEPETNESDEDDEDNERVEKLESEVEELKEKLEAQEEEELADLKETIVANSDWDEDELDDFGEDRLEKMVDTVAPNINMKGKAQPRSYDEDDEVEERELVIANKSELEDE